MKQPRVLYLVPDLFGSPGGIARYCRMVCRALFEGHYNVAVIALHDQREEQQEAQKTFPGVNYFPCAGNRAQFVNHAMSASQIRPDFILVGHPHFTSVGWLLARLYHAKLVTFIYGVDAWEPLSPLRRRALCASDLSISISRFTANQAATVNGLPLEFSRLLPNCVDPVLTPSLNGSAKKVSTKSPSLLTVSRILRTEMYKGHDQVIRALPELLQRFPDLVYDVVGDGDGRSEMEALAAQEGVSNSVRFHGVVSDADICRFYANADVFIMPSRREGFGFVFIEAMIQGLPAIGGNIDATPEVIVDGETGFTVNPVSREEIIKAASMLLSDKDLREHMGQAAKHHVEEKFGFPRFKQTLFSYLAELSN